MARKDEGAGRRPLPSPVACPGSPGAQPTGASPGPQEPVPGLLAYLNKRLHAHQSMIADSRNRAMDSRASEHTRRKYRESADYHLTEAREVERLITAYNSARASAGEDGDAAIAQAFREVECGNSEAAIYRQRVMKRADELTAAPQPAHAVFYDIPGSGGTMHFQGDKPATPASPATGQVAAGCAHVWVPGQAGMMYCDQCGRQKPAATPQPAAAQGDGHEIRTYPNRNALIREVCEGLRGYRFDVDPVCVMAIINSIPAQVFSDMGQPAARGR